MTIESNTVERPPDNGVTPTLEALQPQCATVIAARQKVLGHETDRITADPALLDDDRRQLLAELRTDTTALSALGAAVAGTSDYGTAYRACGKVRSQLEIEALEVPKAEAVIAADELGAASSDLGSEAVTLTASLVASAAANPTAIADARAQLAALQSALTTCRAALEGVSDSVLPLRAQDYPTTGATMSSALESLVLARAQLSTALTAAQRAAHDLGLG